ncbi:MAG: hypothetical protein KF784_04745 [Fimbriimonadaceae bacterium]|nr:hypothetical protein [Fimbriimonadaceae bacterium]
MTSKDLIVRLTENSFKELFRTARTTQADKLDWKPAETARSTMEMLQECAQSPIWTVGLLNERKMPDFDQAMFEEMRNERAQWTTIDACEAEALNRLPKLLDAIDRFPEADMEQTMFLPFGGGRAFTFWELMMFPYWNAVYHVGQINYIQRMYGDVEMH